jgi:hypothetical protein
MQSRYGSWDISHHGPSKNGHWFVSGAGGKSHYQASPNPDWSFVNDKDCGYLQIQIDNTDGKITSTHFYGLDRKLIH